MRSYEYFEKLPQAIKNNFTEKQKDTFKKINTLDKLNPLDNLTKLIAYKLNSTQCEKTDAFITALKAKALQSTSLTQENISKQPYTSYQSRESDLTTTQSITDPSLLSDDDEINRISIDQGAINRIGYTEPIIQYIDSVTDSITFEERNIPGGKMQTRRKKPSKNLRKHKKTLRKRSYRKHK